MLSDEHDLMMKLDQELQQKYNIKMNNITKKNIINIMTNQFPTGTGRSTYSNCVFIELSGTDYSISETYRNMLNNPEFKAMIKEVVEFGISRYQTNYDGYINRINEIRAMYNVPSRLIEIEITEGTYLANTEATSQFIENLHYYGYKVSMDDFGSGYSNLSSLAALDVDLMKLDRGFCTNRHNKKENVILSFVMTLAKSLNIDVLCEGVENEDLVEYLKSVGCTIVQGFLYDRPIPASDFMKKYLLK
jgi:EAL domain-containing protein (putative c-di-GMP-specific phosphodiesterase class I)